jgi:sugar phosphate isomerase/epimerase
MERRSMKLGVFTVGLPDLTPEEAVRELKDAGYDGVEWRVIPFRAIDVTMFVPPQPTKSIR